MFGWAPVCLRYNKQFWHLINIYLLTIQQCRWGYSFKSDVIWPTHKDQALTSGSKFLKTYILVFSIMANRSGLSFAHFMSQTSLRSNLDGSPADAWFPVLSSVKERASRSNKVSTPAMSIIARRLKKTMIICDLYVTAVFQNTTSDSTNCFDHSKDMWTRSYFLTPQHKLMLTWNCSSRTNSRLCCSKCISGWEQHLGGCIYGWCQTHGPISTYAPKTLL